VHTVVAAAILNRTASSVSTEERILTVSLEGRVPSQIEDQSKVSASDSTLLEKANPEVLAHSIPEEVQEAKKPTVEKRVRPPKPSRNKSSSVLSAPAAKTFGQQETNSKAPGSSNPSDSVTAYDAKLLGISVFYPRYARQHNQSGRVICRVTVDPLGNIISATVVKSSGFPILDEAAVSTLRVAQFDTSKYGNPREALIAFAFRLED